MKNSRENPDYYANMVATLSKPGVAILPTMDFDKAELLHMAVGVSTEAGELLDAFKRHIFYNKPLDEKNVREELGDLEFYMERIRQMLHISREEVLAENYHKLMTKRYPDGYSDEAATARADKIEEAVVQYPVTDSQ